MAQRNLSSRHLVAQKRMAMELMKVGRRGVWLDPHKKDVVASATTRAQIRELIEQQGACACAREPPKASLFSPSHSSRPPVIRRRKPRFGQSFVMPPQYMSRFRQRLLCDPKVRGHPRKTVGPAPSSGKRYYAPEYWMREERVREVAADADESTKKD